MNDLSREEAEALFDATPLNERSLLLSHSDGQVRSVAYWRLHPYRPHKKVWVGGLWTYDSNFMKGEEDV